MEITLRPYQQKLIQDLYAAVAGGARSVLANLPTGGGKTTAFAEISRRAIGKGRSVCVIAHRHELVEQGAARLRLFGLDPVMIVAGQRPQPGQISVASVQTLVRSIADYPAPDLLITDEAHHAVAGSWRVIADAWGSAVHLGFTATPCRLDGRGLGDAFDVLVNGPSVDALTRDGYLVPADIYAPSVPDLAGVRTRAGDYSKEDLEKALAGSSIVGDAVRSFLSFVPAGGTAVAFCASVSHAMATADAFNAAGVPAAVLTGKDRKTDRDATLARLAVGELRIVCSVDVVSEGFDLPSINAVIMLRPTKSLSLYLQQAGRSLRPADGKVRAVILDHAGNALRHGHPADDREWTLDGDTQTARDKRTAEDGTAVSVRQCMSCYAVHRSAPICPYCATVHPVDQRIPRARAGELRKLEREELARLEAERKAKAKAERVLPLFVFQKMARQKQMPPGWAAEAHRQHVESKARSARQ